MRRALPALFLLSALTACDVIGGGGGATEDSKVTETRMDDLDSLEGTISDEMVDTDAISDQPMIEAASVTGAKPAAKKDAAAKEPAKAETKSAPVKVESEKASDE